MHFAPKSPLFGAERVLEGNFATEMALFGAELVLGVPGTPGAEAGEQAAVLFVAGFLLILQVMIGLVKNSLRRRALKGVKLFGGCRQIFPKIGAIGRVGVLCKVESMADVQAFEELVQFMSGCRQLTSTADVSGAKFTGTVMEGKKCFKESASREAFVEFCKGAGFNFLPKGGTDWKGVPDPAFVKCPAKGEYDLLVCLNPAEDFTLEYLAMSYPSRFTTGVRTGGKVPYSLVLEPGEGSLTFKEYVEKLLQYLVNMQQ